MKLFIVTCLKEHQDIVTKIFKQANIHLFSTAELVGFKDGQPPDPLKEWFASGGEKFDSLLFFSFTSPENAQQGILLVNEYNETNPTDFPIRAFIVPVEKSSYLSSKNKEK